MADTVLSDDAKVILLLCSTVALDASAGLKSLGPKAWSGVEKRFGGTAVESPAGLAGMPAEAMVRDLGIPLHEAERMSALLDRAGRFAIEFDRLRSRGIWAVTKADGDYPGRLRERLADGSPPVLFGAGSRDLLNMRGVGVVGSRAADEETLGYAASVGSGCARAGVAIISGAAKGVDESAMLGSLGAGGLALGVLADSLERQVQRKQWRDYAIAEQLVLVTPYHPAKPFDRGGAMGRNKLVYCLSDAAVVVTTAEGKGGTWTGAVEALRAGWVPVFVRETAGYGSPGNARLIAEAGARPLPALAGETVEVLADCLGVCLDRPAPTRADGLTPSGAQGDETPVAVASHDQTQSPSTQDDEARLGRVPTLETTPRPAPALVRDVYVELLPVLLIAVRAGLKVKHIAETMDVVLSQAQAWLTRAADDGLILKGPKGFQLTQQGQGMLAESALSEYDDVSPAECVTRVHDGILEDVADVLVGAPSKKDALDRIARGFGLTGPQAEDLLRRRASPESGGQEELFQAQPDQEP
jgi:predicted Rossmann fold nucleotide-binding protein DprA/Smf involved in DNA uptake